MTSGDYPSNANFLTLSAKPSRGMDGSYPVLSVFYWALDSILYFPIELELSSCEKSETLFDRCFVKFYPSADELLFYTSSEF